MKPPLLRRLAAPILLGVLIFLALPVQYRIDVNRSGFDRVCELSDRLSRAICERPEERGIMRQAPFIVTWWTVTQVGEAVPLDAIIIDWGPKARGQMVRNGLLAAIPLSVTVISDAVKRRRARQRTDSKYPPEA